MAHSCGTPEFTALALRSSIFRISWLSSVVIQGALLHLTRLDRKGTCLSTTLQSGTFHASHICWGHPIYILQFCEHRSLRKPSTLKVLKDRYVANNLADGKPFDSLRTA